MKIKYRKHIRLRDFDYKTNGYYFVTVVTRNRLPLLCSGGCKPAIEECIKKLPEFISGLSIDWFTVMDNHVHIILIFNGCSRTLGRVVSAMKSAISKVVAAGINPSVAAGVNPPVAANVNSQKGDLHRPLQSMWQWNYYEHVIRNEKGLSKIREYIENNPTAEKLNWHELDNCG